MLRSMSQLAGGSNFCECKQVKCHGAPTNTYWSAITEPTLTTDSEGQYLIGKCTIQRKVTTKVNN